MEPHIVHGEDIGGIGHGQGQDIAGALKGQHLVPLGQILGDQGDDPGIDGRPLFQVGGGDAVLHPQEAHDVLIGAESGPHHDASELAALPALDFHDLIQLGIRDELGLDEHFPELADHWLPPKLG